MKKRKLLITLMLTLSLAFISVMALAGCGLFSSTTLEDGVYRIDRIYINGERITSAHTHWAALNSSQWTIEGNQATLTITPPGLPSSSTTIDHRIRGGYLEQRHTTYTAGRWTRENGSAASEFVSTRVENGEIVVRYGSPSALAIFFGGRVYIYYSLVE